MIDDKHITSFVALHEISELKPTTKSGQADVGADDLMLMSKMVSTATATQNAKMVSKKITYKTFSQKLSADFQLSGIAAVSTDVEEVSSIVDSYVEELSNDISTTSSFILDELSTTVDTLSTTIDSEYSKKHHGTLALAKKDPESDVAQIAISVQYDEDGQPSVSEFQPATWLINPDGFKSTTGGIRPLKDDEQASMTSSVSIIADTSSIVYEISNDCYLNISLTSHEAASSTPIKVVLSSSAESETSALVGEFNNSGGFAGTFYDSTYHMGFMVKSIDRSTTPASLLSVVIIRSGGDKILSGSALRFDEMHLYNMPAKDELSDYAKIPDGLQEDIGSTDLSVMKFSLDNQGMIVSAQVVYYGYATSSDPGFILLPPDGFCNDRQYPVKLSNDQMAYAEVPYASKDIGGVIKTGFSYLSSVSDDAGVSCKIGVDGNGNGFGVIPAASDDVMGVIRCGFEDIQDLNGLSAGLMQDQQLRSFVKLPVAKIDKLGLMKVGTEDVTSVNKNFIRHVFIDSENRGTVNVMTDGSLEASQFFGSMYDADDITLSVQLSKEKSTEISSDEVISTMFNSQILASKVGSFKWTAQLDEKINTAVAVYAVYHGHSSVEAELGAQIVVDGKAVASFFPGSCKTCSSGEWFDTKFIGSFPELEKIEIMSGSSSFQSGDEVDDITFIVKDLMMHRTGQN